MKGFFARIGAALQKEPNLRALFPPKAPTGELSRAERARLRGRRNAFFFLFLPIAVFYMEVVFHFAVYGELPLRTLLILLLFSGAFGFLTSGIALLMPLRANRVFTTVVFVITTLIFESQYVYFRFFKSFYRFATMGMAGGALRDFWRETLSTISTSWFGILLLALPLIFFCIRRKNYAPAFAPTFAFRIYLLILALLCHLLAVGVISLDNGDFGDRYYYKTEFSAAEATKRFGVITDMRLDMHVTIFGERTADDDPSGGESVNPFESTADPEVTTEPADTSETTEATTEPPAPIEYGDNVMDIDFAALAESESNKEIKAAHEYFGSLTPTKKNKYTGMFKGKNLIFMTLEGFSYKTIDKDRTPTLYKMATEGFVFNNYYNSLWGGSTATGEYTTMTGLFHNSAKCLEMSAKDNMYFTMGNQLSRLGYKTYAFHNHYYTYYGRDKSHPNFGYEFIAINHGLEGLTDCWPRSDYEMAVATLPYYINLKQPWHAYYHACQYEVELMLEELVRQLDEAGELENTVFVMNADHYPYALSDSELAELYGIPEAGIHKNFDLLRNGLILWSASMTEPVVVDKPCSAIDIIPTLSNLFGLEYDSRLFAGVDILSDTMPLVILNQDGDGSAWNWINAYGEYHSATKTFTPYAGFEASDEEIAAYVKQMNGVVQRKNKYVRLILEKNYYAYLFGK